MTTKTRKYQRADLTARITVVRRENPCRSGTAAHRRVAAVLRSGGKTVRDAVRAGARTSTVRFLAAAKVVRLAKGATA